MIGHPLRFVSVRLISGDNRILQRQVSMFLQGNCQVSLFADAREW
jgi:hypothetical protein